MRAIIGFGNDLRGEDAFGIDVLHQLQEYSKKTPIDNTKLISAFQLTPEICLELLDSTKIVFIDASYSINLEYTLACSIEKTKNTNLSHHISPQVIMSMLKSIYNLDVEYEIYSMTTCKFENISNKNKYENCVREVFNFIKNS